MMRMRMKFHEQLDELTDRLASMCRLAGDAVQAATEALVLADLPLAERIFDLNEQIEELRGPCEDLAMALLALQGPVARDLRQVVTGAPGGGSEPDGRAGAACGRKCPPPSSRARRFR
nr:hypothetical protein GCM10017611_81470 [Rhodococcus wratislaviensis]